MGWIIFFGGWEEILEIMKGVWEWNLVVFWLNGLEMRKMIMGCGYSGKKEDLIFDEEVI